MGEALSTDQELFGGPCSVVRWPCDVMGRSHDPDYKRGLCSVRQADSDWAWSMSHVAGSREMTADIKDLLKTLYTSYMPVIKC